MSEERAITDLRPNPDNPRQGVREDSAFMELLASIERQGIIQPLLIDESNLILAGHRRYFAAQIIGLQRVPVHVLKHHNAPHLIPLIENLQRLDLGVLEAADYFLKCSREHGMPIAAISEATGISNHTVSNYIKLAQAPQDVRERIERDEIPLNAAFELLKHDDELIQELIQMPRLTRDYIRARVRFGTNLHQVEAPSDSPCDSAKDEQTIDRGILERIYDRIDSGCYTPESISRCDECGSPLFSSLTLEDIQRYIDVLVSEGRVGSTKQGGKKDNQRGSATKLFVPSDDGLGSFRGAVNAFQRQPTPRKVG